MLVDLKRQSGVERCQRGYWNEPTFQSGDDRVRILDFGRRMEEGLMVKADTLEALARQIEVPPEALRETVDRYNRFVDEEHDPEFGRKTLVHRQGELRRIEEAPFYAYPSTAAVFGTYCGLRIDADMRVIDVFGEPIAGLYAAGEVVGGFHGGAYMTGSALGKAVVFGRMAVRTACEGAAVAAWPSSLELFVHYAKALKLVGLTSADLSPALLLRHGR